MSEIQLGAVGTTYRVSTKDPDTGDTFDLSGFSELTLTFIKTGGSEVDKVTTDGVTAPAVTVEDEDLGTLLANTYFEYDIEAGLIDELGQWASRGTYTDGTPKNFPGTKGFFTVVDC